MAGKYTVNVLGKPDPVLLADVALILLKRLVAGKETATNKGR